MWLLTLLILVVCLFVIHNKKKSDRATGNSSTSSAWNESVENYRRYRQIEAQDFEELKQKVCCDLQIPSLQSLGDVDEVVTIKHKASFNEYDSKIFLRKNLHRMDEIVNHLDQKENMSKKIWSFLAFNNYKTHKQYYLLEEYLKEMLMIESKYSIRINYVTAAGYVGNTKTLFVHRKEIDDFVQNNNVNTLFQQKQRTLMTSSLRESIKQRDNYTCQLCGNSIYKEPNLLLEIDHIVPISKGGKTEESNLRTLCWKCNRSKGNKILE